MNFEEQIRILEATKGEPAKLTLATIDLAYPELIGSERAALTETLEAVSIAHWCTTDTLTTMLDISIEESAKRLARLARLSVVEPFIARGNDAINVHEAHRLALREWVAAKHQIRFRTLSGRLASHFENDFTAAGRIEWIYHLLCSDMERGTTELERLGHQWTGGERPEDQYALAAALTELERSQMVQGRARAWVLLTIAGARMSRGETAQLADIAMSILDVARLAADERAIGHAQYLLGEALCAQGKLEEAQVAFGESTAIVRRLTEEDFRNVEWQSDLSGIQRKMGEVLQAQGKLVEAQAAFVGALSIRRRLAERDPNNASRQRDFAVIQRNVGEVLEAQGKLAEARAAFQKSMTISRRLKDQDPLNASRKRDLAVALCHFGDVLQAQGEPAEGRAAFNEFLLISQQLVEQDPGNAGWKWDLAVAHSRVGGFLWAQGELTEALTSFSNTLAIMRRLVGEDPANADWQRDLAAAQSHIGRVFEAQGEYSNAENSFQANLAVMRRLARQDPSNASWWRDLAMAQSRLGSVLQVQGKLADARASFEECLSIMQRLTQQDPSNAEWQRDLEDAYANNARLEGD